MQDTHAVLIVTDDAAFARDLIGRWQIERSVPGFTVMSTELFPAAASGNFDLAIVGPVNHGRLPTVLSATDSGAHPVICLLESASQIQAAKAGHPRLIVLRQHEAWLDSVLLLSAECLKRVDAVSRLQHAEKLAQSNARAAALGRYMLENRHDLSNLLTSVLGNAELLLDDCGLLPELSRDQVQTIHDTALHMHGIMQRFSLLAIEMQVSEKESQDETLRPSHLTIAAS